MSVALLNLKIKQFNKLESKNNAHNNKKFKYVFAYNNLKEMNQKYAGSKENIIIFNIGNA